MGRHWILAGVGAAAAALFLTRHWEARPEVQIPFKVVPLLCALVWLWPPRGRYARWVCTGMVLSLVGDVLLELPGLFLPGLGFFLFAQASYVTAYLMVTRTPSLLRAVPFLGLGAGAFLFLRSGLGELAVPVAAYIAVISAMMWRSAAMVGAGGEVRREQWAALVGAVLFAASDTLLALHRFVQPVPGAGYSIILLYWAGQLGIAFSAREPRPVEAQAPARSGELAG
jgi:uncharacterized membrane protein YhhN